MNIERLLAKLRWDDPRHLAAKGLARLRSRRERAQRRALWSGGGPTVCPEDTPADFTSAAAEQLWPGAANRTWLHEGPRRWPEWYAEAVRRAVEAAEGRFDLLGSGLTDVRDASGRIRWHLDFKSGFLFPADCLYLDVPICVEHEGADIKVPWELSRFQHLFFFLWTDPERYGAVFLQQWQDWLAANPVARGVNWACTMDVALRAISWTAALAACGRQFDEPARRQMWASLMTHGYFIRTNLEWAPVARTNHYFSDLVGLAVLGAILLPHPVAQEWLTFAARELHREIGQQFGPDGFNRECSTTYHRLMVELALLGYRACVIGGHALGGLVRRRLVAACRALQILSDAAGRIPLIGDNDSSRVFPMAVRDDGDVRHMSALGAGVLDAEELASGDVSPEAVLLCGPAVLTRFHRKPVTSPRLAGRALLDAGLFVLGRGPDHLVVRCGPLTYRPVGSHKHLDQLSLTLSVNGRPLIVDPGQYCYTPFPEWRNRFIDSRMHNTVTVDDQPQCRLFPLSRMSFSLIDEARPRCLAWGADEQHARLVGRHRGYRRLPGGADHIRTVRYDAAARMWTVTDQLPLRGAHRVTWRFHLHPAVVATPDGNGWRLQNGDARVTLRWINNPPSAGTLDPAWFAPAYGCRQETRVLRFECQAEGPLEASFQLQAEGGGE